MLVYLGITYLTAKMMCLEKSNKIIYNRIYEGKEMCFMRKMAKTNKIGWQLILMTAFIIVLPSILFFAFIVNKYSQDLLSRAITERQNILKEINLCTELQFEEYQELSMIIYYDQTIKSFIDSCEYENPSEEELTSLTKAMNTIINSKSCVDTLMICFGDTVYRYGRNFFEMDEYRNKYEDLVLERDGRCIWLPTEQMRVAVSHKKDFALGRAINTSYKTVGTLYMFCSSDLFSQIMTNDALTRDNSHYYVVGIGNQIVMSDDTAAIGTSKEFEFGLDDCVGDEGHFSIGSGKNQQIVTYARMKNTGWVSLIISDSNAISANARSVQKIAQIFTMAYFAALALGYMLIIRLIIRPIQKLSSGMNLVSEGKFMEVQISSENNEITRLTECFNDMVLHIRNLMNRVREEELEKNRQRIKVLYMQIGPHFLYNTLTSIKWLAVLNNQQNIKQMVDSLMKLMTGVMYNEKDDIPLKKELELLEGYIYIQKMRFTNFTVIYDIPQSIMNVKIGRFMLQPFVENSILHGLRDVPYEGVIKIHAWCDDVLNIEVKDNGRGFDAGILEGKHGSDQEKDHIGIKNVKERIQLHYGKDYGVCVTSSVQNGTTVLIRIPIIREEPDND